MYSTLCANTHHEETFSKVDGNIKNWISQEQTMTISWNKKMLKLYLKDYSFRS